MTTYDCEFEDPVRGLAHPKTAPSGYEEGREQFPVVSSCHRKIHARSHCDDPKVPPFLEVPRPDCDRGRLANRIAPREYACFPKRSDRCPNLDPERRFQKNAAPDLTAW